MHEQLIANVLDDAQARAEAHISDGMGMRGFGAWIHLDDRLEVVTATPFKNLITDAGDLYVIQKVIAATPPASPSAPTVASGMKLGTGSGTPAKNGTNATLNTYLSGTNVPFDSSFPSYSSLGAGLGVKGIFQSTFGPGVGTTATLAEAIVCNDAATNATTLAANAYARTLNPNGSQPKAAGDTVIIVWNWLGKGA